MKKNEKKLSLVLLLVTFLSFAQNKFEPGYYIDNSGAKVECLIKNYDWKNNPINIEIKKTIEDKIINKKEIWEINEFGINEKSKFIKVTVKIDESSQNMNVLSYDPNPVFSEKTVFLKVLVEGKSNLYYFENENYDRFFFTVDNKIEQLVYKQYNTPEGNIKTNETYKQQLFVNFKCNNDQKSIVALKYKNNDLIDYFIKTNNCISGNTESISISKKIKSEINFRVNLLLNSSKSTYEIPYSYSSDRKTSLSFGFESEIILPYNNKNWSFIFDPSFIQNKESVTALNTNNSTPVYTLNNNNFTFRLPIGIRRYFRLNANKSLFANATYAINISKSKINSYNHNNNSTTIIADDIFHSSNFAVGFGYQYKRYSAEIKYNTNTLFYYNYLKNEYTLNQISLKLGYKLF